MTHRIQSSPVLSLLLVLVSSVAVAACASGSESLTGVGGSGGDGSGGSGAADNDPFSNPSGCLTEQTWSGKPGLSMNPGKACIACHSKKEDAPHFNAAGTVYASGHETDLCYGVDGTSPDYSDVVIEITDANGVVYELHPGPTGNFAAKKADFAYPYKARIVTSTGERIMHSAQHDGDCNGCHTEAGKGNGSKAPGRIVLPL